MDGVGINSHELETIAKTLPMSRPEEPFACDSVAYPGLVHPQTHPTQLAPKARLFGLLPASPESCHVLELGCGDGTNLVAMAMAHPNSSYVGVDLSGAAIARGRAVVAESGVTSVRLIEGNLTDIDASWGKFDYILAHGVYSWVPSAVRDAVLRVAGSLLAPDGVAFVSYLALPGAHLREMIRSITRFHTSATLDPEEKIHNAISVIGFLGRASTENSLYHQLLQNEFESLRHRDHGNLFHDELADISTPLFFRDFCAEANRYGLQFLTDAEYVEPPGFALTEEAIEVLKPLRENRLLYEQYLDLVHGRRFRQTLLCRARGELKLDRSLMDTFFLACAADPVDAPEDLSGPEPLSFQGRKRSTFRTEHPLSKAVFCELARIYPERLCYEEALRRGADRIDQTLPVSPVDAETFRALLTKLYAPSLVELHTGPLPYAARVSERPLASPLAACQVRAGDETVINLSGRPVGLPGPLERFLLLILDGTRTLDATVDELREFLLKANEPGEGHIPDLPSAANPELRAIVERVLVEFVRNSLLIR